MSIMNSLAIQQRVVHALLLREMLTRYGKNNIGFLWLLAEPLLFMSAILILAINIRMDQLNLAIPLAAFALTGYSGAFAWRDIANQCKNAMRANSGLMHHRNVKILDIFISRILLEFISNTATFIILILILVNVGLINFPVNTLYVIFGWLLLNWFGGAIGLCLGILSEYSEVFGRIWNATSFPIFAVSGAAFFVDWMPEPIRSYLLWVPMIHGIETMRHGFFGDIVTTYEDPMYFITVNLCFTLVGLLLVKNFSEGLLND
ncbi:MAG: Polysialic acid transport protein KpsM [Pseudomonadota bacterium]